MSCGGEGGGDLWGSVPLGMATNNTLVSSGLIGHTRLALLILQSPVSRVQNRAAGRSIFTGVVAGGGGTKLIFMQVEWSTKADSL